MPEPTGPTEPISDDPSVVHEMLNKDYRMPGDGNPVSDDQAAEFVQDPTKAHAMAIAEDPYRTMESDLRIKGENRLADIQAGWVKREGVAAGEQYEKEKNEIYSRYEAMFSEVSDAISIMRRYKKDAVNLHDGRIQESIQETEIPDTLQIAFEEFLDALFTPEDKQIFKANLRKLHKNGGMGFPKFIRGSFEVPTKLGYNIKVARFVPDNDDPNIYSLPKPTYAIALVNREKK